MIFNYLPITDLLRIRGVCKHWQILDPLPRKIVGLLNCIKQKLAPDLLILSTKHFRSTYDPYKFLEIICVFNDKRYTNVFPYEAEDISEIVIKGNFHNHESHERNIKIKPEWWGLMLEEEKNFKIEISANTLIWNKGNNETKDGKKGKIIEIY
ncbi:270_t:CDS:2 [Diversispora eburnea]|uniref:270_t:CDS:1 n=1 Tax=Diversispora eburnea TaxID=1213867 RepID=A0A9N8VKF7_9GLOM|nr:270_t:CDS:2 [Diversispora eburnea]